MSKPNKANLELAKKIIEQHAVVTEVEAVETVSDKNDPFKRHEKKAEAYSIEVPIIGYSIFTYSGTEAECKKQAAERIAGDLDEGVIVLSDAWAEDNLRADD